MEEFGTPYLRIVIHQLVKSITTALMCLSWRTYGTAKSQVFRSQEDGYWEEARMFTLGITE